MKIDVDAKTDVDAKEIVKNRIEFLKIIDCQDKYDKQLDDFLNLGTKIFGKNFGNK